MRRKTANFNFYRANANTFWNFPNREYSMIKYAIGNAPKSRQHNEHKGLCKWIKEEVSRASARTSSAAVGRLRLIAATCRLCNPGEKRTQVRQKPSWKDEAYSRNVSRYSGAHGKHRMYAPVGLLQIRVVVICFSGYTLNSATCEWRPWQRAMSAIP